MSLSEQESLVCISLVKVFQRLYLKSVRLPSMQAMRVDIKVDILLL